MSDEEKEPKRQRRHTKQSADSNTTIMTTPAVSESSAPREVQTEDQNKSKDAAPLAAAPQSAGGALLAKTPDDPQMTTSGRPTIKQHNVPTFRMTRKLQKLQIRARNNLNNLESFIDAGRIPKGLTVRRFPLNIPNPSISFQLRWDQAHMELSMKLTKLLHEFWREKLEETELEVGKLASELQNKCSVSELSHVNEVLQTAREEYLSEIRARNAQKVSTEKPMEQS